MGDALLNMKNYLLPTALFGAIALFSQISSAVALSPVAIERIARQTTIQIDRCSQGSGVIIQKNRNTYTVLTSAQAVQSSGCEIIAPDNNRYQISKVQVFPNNIDLAVVNFTSTKNYPVAKLVGNSERSEVGSPVYVFGVSPSTTNSKPVFTFTKGDIVSNSSQQQSKGYSLVSSNNPLSGRNGSPIWNDRGEPIAIQGQSNIDPKLQSARNYNVRVKTGYKLGITIDTFAKFASAAGISGYTPVTIAPNKTPVDDLITSAVLKESKADYRGMLADLNQAAFLDSQNARLYYLRGVTKSMLGNQDAIEDYNRAIALKLNEPLVYHNRGVTKFAFGNYKGSIEDYNRAISLDPNLASAYYHRGNAKVALAQRGGLEDFNRAISLDPNLAPAYYSRGLIKSKSGDKKGEIADLDRAISIDPNYTEAHEQLGFAKSNSGDFKGAIISFNRAISLNPKNPDTYSSRANARSKTGDDRGAILDYDKSIALNANNAQAYASRGSIKSKLGDKKGAILDLKKAANRFKRQRQTASYQQTILELKRLGA
jgi:tetratricopeptide (TPR) repeat protein